MSRMDLYEIEFSNGLVVYDRTRQGLTDKVNSVLVNKYGFTGRLKHTGLNGLFVKNDVDKCRLKKYIKSYTKIPLLEYYENELNNYLASYNYQNRFLQNNRDIVNKKYLYVIQRRAIQQFYKNDILNGTFRRSSL